MFQNTHLHFNFCCSKKGFDVANKVAKIVILSDDRPKFVPDLMPDGEIMECLFKSVLDRHPNFIKKEAKKQKDPTATKKKEKQPKGHVTTLKKKASLKKG